MGLSSSQSDKDLVLIIIHTSIGELQWILPFACHMKQKGNLEIVTLFFSESVHESAKTEGVYYRLLKEVSSVLEKRNLFTFILNNRRRVKYIFKDFWPIHEGSLASRIRDVCNHSKLILYPHSFALYDREEKIHSIDKSLNSHDKDCYDLLVVNTKMDVSYWSKRIILDRIKVVGALGYSKAWIRRLIENSSNNDYEDNLNRDRFKTNVLLAIRGPKSGLLENDDYEYLIDTALEELFLVPGVYVYLKPHPRQDQNALKKKLKKYAASRYEIVYQNPFSLSQKVDFAVTFWTSVTTDILTLGVPSIEYFRFRGGYKKWLALEDGSKTSYYADLNLTESVNNSDEFKLALNRMFKDLQEIKAYRKKKFDSVFLDVNKAGDNLLNEMWTLERKSSSTFVKYIVGYSQILFSSVKSLKR